jgi:hypothetical protein
MSADLMEVFGPYLLLRPLGRGGMGVVYTARTQDDLRPLVALKRMRADADVPTFRERFEHECALALRLRHPHLLETLEAGSLDGQLFVASELIRGQDLASIVHRLGTEGHGMPAAGAARVLADVLAALRYVHTAVEDDGRPLRLLHRDVTPGNVLVGYDGRSHLADFGLARSLLTDPLGLTATGTVLGTPRYMAPELFNGVPATVQSDLYAVGALAYCMLTGQGPYPGGPKEVITALLEGPPPPLSALRQDLPPRFTAVVTRLMDRRPEARFASAAEATLHLNDAVAREGLGVSHAALGTWLGALFEEERARQSRQWTRDLAVHVPRAAAPRPVTRVLPAAPGPLSGELEVWADAADEGALDGETQLSGVAPLAPLEADPEPDTAKQLVPFGALDLGVLPTIVPATAPPTAPMRPEELDTLSEGGRRKAPFTAAAERLPRAAPARRAEGPGTPPEGAPVVRAASAVRGPQITAHPGPTPPLARAGRAPVLLAVALVAGLGGAAVSRLGVGRGPSPAEQVALSERVGAAKARLGAVPDSARRGDLEAILVEARALVRDGEVARAPGAPGAGGGGPRGGRGGGWPGSCSSCRP